MKGIGVSPGISIGKALIIKKTEAAVSGILTENDDAKAVEIEKFNKAVIVSVEEIENIKGSKELFNTNEGFEIIDTQIEFLNDPQIKGDVLDKINFENKTAYDAVSEVIYTAIQMFRNLDDEYFRARAADISDIGNRILKNLGHASQPIPDIISENTIIIAEDISPSDVITLDITKIAGFATQLGGKTSHAAIIAKAKGIPAVVACGDDLLNIKNDDTIILDGSSGEVIIRPDPVTIGEYKSKQIKVSQELSFLNSLKTVPAQTTDGRKVRLFANISNEGDLDQVFENGGEGVGLFRTEFMFLGRNSFPSEEEQFQFYRQVAIKSEK